MKHKKDRTIKLAKSLATGLGAGYLPWAPGTFGTLWGVLIFLCLSHYPALVYIIITAILFAIGVYVSRQTAMELSIKDPSCVVIDEIVGFMVASWFVPFTWQNLILIFILFRLFDILKPFPIKRIEKLKHGWGIMLDDVMAGAYAWIVWALVHVIMSS